MRLGIDRMLESNNTCHRRYDRDLARTRGEAANTTLVASGVPASRMTSGANGDNRLRREGRDEELVRTDRIAQTR